jgi:hypothetical protein
MLGRKSPGSRAIRLPSASARRKCSARAGPRERWDPMYALILIWAVAASGSGGLQVGSFNTLDACKKAAAEATWVTAPNVGRDHAFMCVQSSDLGKQTAAPAASRPAPGR